MKILFRHFLKKKKHQNASALRRIMRHSQEEKLFLFYRKSELCFHFIHGSVKGYSLRLKIRLIRKRRLKRVLKVFRINFLRLLLFYSRYFHLLFLKLAKFKFLKLTKFQNPLNRLSFVSHLTSKSILHEKPLNHFTGLCKC